VWRLVEPADPARPEGYRASHAVNLVILSLIGLNLAAIVLGSVEGIEARFGPLLSALDVVTVVVFTAEYAARLWSRTAAVPGAHPVGERLRFAARPLLIIDLLAILPFYLPFLGADLVVLRSLRLVQVFRVAKAGRYLGTLRLFARVFRGKREELVVTATVTALLLLITASLMYFAEHAVQPEAFSSIPATMWWAVATLTTVGYGDVYPVTVVGRMLGAVTAVLGIGLFALPTGIVGAGFVEELERHRKGGDTMQAPSPPRPENSHSQKCPCCGRP
jgi:voltage-gated potassium channel